MTGPLFLPGAGVVHRWAGPDPRRRDRRLDDLDRMKLRRCDPVAMHVVERSDPHECRSAVGAGDRETDEEQRVLNKRRLSGPVSIA